VELLLAYIPEILKNTLEIRELSVFFSGVYNHVLMGLLIIIMLENIKILSFFCHFLDVI